MLPERVVPALEVLVLVAAGSVAAGSVVVEAGFDWPVAEEWQPVPLGLVPDLAEVLELDDSS